MASRTIRTVNVMTDASGDFEQVVAYRGQLIAISVAVGELSTPDIDVADGTRSFLSVNGVAADTVYHPMVAGSDNDGTDGDGFTAPAVFGGVTVTVAGGGNAKTGKIRLLFG